MADSKAFDLVVIGGGPGGYVAAIRAAQLGMSVACVERDKLGGVCLNWGCIPTKALLAGAEFYHQLKHDAEAWGIHAENVSHDWPKVITRSRNVAGQLNKGVHFLFKKNKIEHFEASAYIPEIGKIELRDGEGNTTDTLQAKHIIIATGARPRALPGTPFDGDKVISSKEAMNLPEQPDKLLVIGAGAIGMEFAYFYNAFGTEVTVVEMLDRLLPIEDAEVSKAIAKTYRKLGITALTAYKTTNVEVTDSGIKATVEPVEEGKGEAQTIEADKVLVAIGVQGNVENVLGENLGVEIDRGHIKVDKETYKTNVNGIYAIGDVIGPPWLAHVASEEGVNCVEHIAGHSPVPIDYESIPGCTYCHPQVASIGLTEEACKERGIEYTVGNFPFQASGKAQALGETAGFCKIIAGRKHGEIL
ncbi:MAG: dihydrolipoyl dehydrogenase, partial [Rhodospirillales bacterium]|nr:dihydrolipoyl dehydrogenase [Rhodospirillales bacterium]